LKIQLFLVDFSIVVANLFCASNELNTNYFDKQLTVAVFPAICELFHFDTQQGLLVDDIER
jgi:hypothetical protein